MNKNIQIIIIDGNSFKSLHDDSLRCILSFLEIHELLRMFITETVLSYFRNDNVLWLGILLSYPFPSSNKTDSCKDQVINYFQTCCIDCGHTSVKNRIKGSIKANLCRTCHAEYTNFQPLKQNLILGKTSSRQLKIKTATLQTRRIPWGYTSTVSLVTDKIYWKSDVLSSKR
eukprot:GHVL01013904.1.p1 GENE.GHVL01013904.1~~GHVL01013904.1.p1  ORF type:complete len:172 (-),score=22.34 GHVL01013904.1:143-658(-)